MSVSTYCDTAFVLFLTMVGPVYQIIIQSKAIPFNNGFRNPACVICSRSVTAVVKPASAAEDPFSPTAGGRQ